jgi:hypothetical protein
MRVRATVLPAAAQGRYWLELLATGSEGALAVPSAAKLLMRGKALSLEDIERVYVMIAGHQPIEIPIDQIHFAATGPAVKARATRLGTERVRVAAGSFEAEVRRVSGMRMWRAARVPVWGLVKARAARQSVELLAFGADGGQSVFPAGWDQGSGSESRK